MKCLTHIFILLIMIFGNKLNADPLELGANFPSVEARLDSGETIALPPDDLEGYILVYFYPKANTPGCTKQACSLRDAYEELVEKGVRIFGVSKDKVESQQAFKEKYALPFALIADYDSVVINAFGVPKKLGFASRQAFLFKNGKLVWRDLAASTSRQAEDVLNVLQGTDQKSN